MKPARDQLTWTSWVLLVVLASRCAAQSQKIRVLFLTDCTIYSDWQTIGMVFSYMHSKHDGPITRVMCCTDKELKNYNKEMLDIVETHIAPSYTVHPRTGDQYAAYNKPEAVIDYMEKVQPPEEYLLVIDSDMLLRKKFSIQDYDVSKGWAVGAYYGYLKGVINKLADKHIPEIARRNDTFAGPKGRRSDQVGGFILIHRDDLRALSKLWLKYTEDVRVDPEAWNLTGDAYATKPGMKPWIAEMYGYSYGAAKANVWHHWDYHTMLYPGYDPSGIPGVLHYGLIYNVEGLEYQFDKHWYFAFDVYKCPPWNLTGHAQLGLFNHPPRPHDLPSKSYYERYRDLIAIEPPATLNAGLCWWHRKRCKDVHHQIEKECEKADEIFFETREALRVAESVFDCVDYRPKCEEWARANECTHSKEYMRTNCRVACKLCTPTRPKEAYDKILEELSHPKAVRMVPQSVNKGVPQLISQGGGLSPTASGKTADGSTVASGGSGQAESSKTVDMTTAASVASGQADSSKTVDGNTAASVASGQDESSKTVDGNTAASVASGQDESSKTVDGSTAAPVASGQADSSEVTVIIRTEAPDEVEDPRYARAPDTDLSDSTEGNSATVPAKQTPAETPGASTHPTASVAVKQAPTETPSITADPTASTVINNHNNAKTHHTHTHTAHSTEGRHKELPTTAHHTTPHSTEGHHKELPSAAHHTTAHSTKGHHKELPTTAQHTTAHNTEGHHKELPITAQHTTAHSTKGHHKELPTTVQHTTAHSSEGHHKELPTTAQHTTAHSTEGHHKDPPTTQALNTAKQGHRRKKQPPTAHSAETPAATVPVPVPVPVKASPGVRQATVVDPLTADSAMPVPAHSQDSADAAEDKKALERQAAEEYSLQGLTSSELKALLIRCYHMQGLKIEEVKACVKVAKQGEQWERPNAPALHKTLDGSKFQGSDLHVVRRASDMDPATTPTRYSRINTGTGSSSHSSSSNSHSSSSSSSSDILPTPPSSSRLHKHALDTAMGWHIRGLWVMIVCATLYMAPRLFRKRGRRTRGGSHASPHSCSD